MNNTTQQSQADQTLWPQPIRDKPKKDIFPTRLLLLWLIPGTVGLIILVLIFGWLSGQANREIVYLAPEDGQVTSTQSDQDNRPVSLGFRSTILFNTEAADSPAVLGIPQWSPNGQHLAATVNNGQQLAIYPGSLLTPTIVNSPETTVFAWLTAASDGWSTRSQYLATIGQNEIEASLLVYNAQSNQFFSNPLPIDTRAGLHWSPKEEELLFTGYEGESSVPTLQIMDAGGNISPFQPDDGQQMRADGVWSPNGKQIAYIAANTYTDTQDILVGSLWTAATDGSGLRQLLSAEEALAPFWDPDGDYLYFTRFLKGSGRFELQRIDTKNLEAPIGIVGPGTENVIRYPFDRNTLFQWSPNGRQLLYQGQGQLPPPWYIPLQLSANAKEQVQAAVPVKGVGLWSPDGRRFVGTGLQDGQVRVWVQKADGGVFTSPDSTDMFVMPADGWSSNSRYSALLRYNGSEIQLAVLNVDSKEIINTGFSVDLKAGLNWHPQLEQVMVTSQEDGITTTLKIYDIENNSQLTFEPQDEQLFHADGAWSPDGNYVAYIARDTLTDTLGLDFYAGSLWVASSTGEASRQLVADGLNFAPIWDGTGNQLFFTRYMTETESFDLYQINLSTGTEERLEASSAEFAQYPFDRQLIQKWSPDGRRWLLQKDTVPEPLILYRADQDGLSSPFPQDLDAQCQSTTPYAVRWAPTNRAVLIACPNQKMMLHWLNSDPVTTYVPGEFPTWQP